jgi:hypothetical protein
VDLSGRFTRLAVKRVVQASLGAFVKSILGLLPDLCANLGLGIP